MKLKVLLSHRKETFLEYVRKSTLSKELKAPLLHFLTGEAHKDDIYYCYPEMFAELFYLPTKPLSEDIEQINLAAYYMYTSLNFKDSLMDNTVTPEDAKKAMLLSFATQEESIKMLGSMFPANSEFWILWNQRRSEYLSAMRTKWNEQITWEAYEQLAEAKSAFAKVSIDIWKVWCGNPEKNTIYQRLLESHRLFTIGFQILDDLLDFQKDFEDKHYNIAHTELANALKAREIVCTEIQILQKHLYIQGVAGNLLMKAISYFDRSLSYLGEDASYTPIWTQVIQLNKRQVQFFILQIETYFKRLYARKTLSVSPFSDTGDIALRLQSAMTFLQSQQNEEGSWEDFYNNAGTSNVWTTAYVLMNLLTTNFLTTEVVNKAFVFLQNSQLPEGWGYSTQAPLADTDSTTCALAAFAANEIPAAEPYQRWATAQLADGGFTTFKDEDDLNDFLANSVSSVSSWMQSHTCVSALAYYFLAGQQHKDETFNRLEQYILQQQKSNGLWESYWWTSPTYATCYAAMGLVKSDYDKFAKQIHEAIDSLLASQWKDGCLQDEMNPNGSVFYTSLLLQLLVSNPKVAAKYEVIAGATAQWLLRQQYSDGSFPSSASMRVPSSSFDDVSQINNWEVKAKYNNMVSEDFARLFSTVAAVQALFVYQQQLAHTA
jgi:hypothetical protein